MADVPGLVLTGLNAVKAGLEADIPELYAILFPGDAEPETIAPRDKWPRPDKWLAILAADAGQEQGIRALGNFEREQRVEGVLRLWVYESALADLAETLETGRRRALNSIEATGKANNFDKASWTVDWTGWRTLTGRTGKPPYVGVAIGLAFRIFE